MTEYDELMFEMLATLSDFEKVIILIVNGNEEYYYGNTLISNSIEFQKDLKKSLQDAIDSGILIPEDILIVVKSYENKYYSDDRMNLLSDDPNEPISMILNDMIPSKFFLEVKKYKNKDIYDFKKMNIYLAKFKEDLSFFSKKQSS